MDTGIRGGALTPPPVSLAVCGGTGGLVAAVAAVIDVSFITHQAGGDTLPVVAVEVRLRSALGGVES